MSDPTTEEALHGQASRPGPTRRPGGRSARVQSAVLAATVDLLQGRGPDELTIPAVAERAGVHASSIYRRWGTAHDLALAAILSRINLEVPTPDTGSLRGDLFTLLHAIAEFSTSPLGRCLIRLALRSDPGPESLALQDAFWVSRVGTFSTVLERAALRGELRPGLDHRTVLELLIAPIHVRTLLTRQPVDQAYLHRITDLVVQAIRE